MKYIQLIVECSTYAQQENIFNKIGKIKYKLPLINSYVVEVSEHDLSTLKGLTGIKNIHNNTRITAQMNIARKIVKADISDGYTGRGVSAAILDTGISPLQDFTYPKSRILAFKDIVGHKTSPYDDNGHGTHVWSSYSYHEKTGGLN